MTKPVLMAVGDPAQYLDAVRQALISRYAGDYEILCETSTERSLVEMAALRAAGAEVVIVLAPAQIGSIPGVEYFAQARELYPHVKRVQLVPWGNRSELKPVLRAISAGQFDRYAIIPGAAPDEEFHGLIAELLRDWQRAEQPLREIVTVIGDPWSARCAELRDLLARGGLRFKSLHAGSDEGLALLRQCGRTDGPFPVLIRFDGLALADPTNEAIAVALGVRHSDDRGVFDLAIVGAGPAGLSAAVYGASEGLRTILLDRESIGGQASASSLIRNYMGFPLGITGAELTNRALDQAWSFGAETSVMREAVDLRADGRNRILTFANGSEIVARAVVLATGASYQRLGIPGLDALVGAGVFYGGGITEAPAMEGQHVYVAGAGNSAGQAAVHLSKYARQVTILARGSSLASSMSDYLVKDVEATENIDVRLQTRIVDGSGTVRLEELVLHDSRSGENWRVPATALFVLIGAQPRTDWLPSQIRRDQRGFLLTGDDLDAGVDGQRSDSVAAAEDGLGARTPKRRRLLLETSMPGVFAAGDVRRGSVKRVASAVGEGAMAIQSVHQYLSRY